MSLRICILETDVLRPELTAQYQGYGRMFEQLFSRQPIAAEFRVYNVMNGDYPADSEVFDAYLVTGSKADSFGTDAWIQTLKAYLLKLYARGEKLLGVCFGHQLLALTLGGKAERADKGWGVGIHRYSLAAPPAISARMRRITSATRCCASRATRSLSTTTPARCSMRARNTWVTRCTKRRWPAWPASTRATWWASGCCGSSSSRSANTTRRNGRGCCAAARSWPTAAPGLSAPSCPGPCAAAP